MEREHWCPGEWENKQIKEKKARRKNNYKKKNFLSPSFHSRATYCHSGSVLSHTTGEDHREGHQAIEG